MVPIGAFGIVESILFVAKPVLDFIFARAEDVRLAASSGAVFSTRVGLGAISILRGIEQQSRYQADSLLLASFLRRTCHTLELVSACLAD